MSKEIVILGGGMAGVATAHKLLKYTVPKAKDLKVVLVSNNSHVYWNFAAVRGVLPDELPDSNLFYEIAPGFSKYLASQFELVIGKARAIDLNGKTVDVGVEGQEVERTFNYHHLVIATGASAHNDMPFKTLSTHEDTVRALHDLQNAIGAAESIVIGGAGPTGVETAAELGYRYRGLKKITLVIDGRQVLPGCMPSVAKAAEKELANLHVELIHEARVLAVDPPSSDKNGSGNGSNEGAGEGSGGGSGGGGIESQRAVITLTNGTTLTADLFLPLFGVQANTPFVPGELLDSAGNVKQQKTLQVEGRSDVWAVGDVGNIERKNAINVESQVIHLAKNLHAALTGNPERVAEYKPSGQVMVFVPLGKKKGTGQMGNFKVFSMVVAYAKGRTFFTEKAPGLVAGRNIVRQPV